MVFRNNAQWWDDVPVLGPDNADTAEGAKLLPETFRLVSSICALPDCYESDGMHSQGCPRSN